MPPLQTPVQRSMAGGELAPALHARADTVKYLSGLRRCRNFLVQRHGGIANRPGFRHILPCKTNDIRVALFRYVSEVAGESLLIEVGTSYIRFFQNGALLNIVGGSVLAWAAGTNYVIGDLASSGGVFYYAVKAGINHVPPNATYWYALTGTVFELPNPFNPDRPNWVQSGRTITLTHKDHPPYELINGGSLVSWVLRAIATASTATPPAGLVLTPGGAGGLTVGYVVTSALIGTYEESAASAQVVNAGTAAPTAAAPHVLTWTIDPLAAEYYVYKDQGGNGTYGFIGTATGAATFKDPGLTPDYTQTAPLPTVKFALSGDYPHVAAYFQQRRFFGYTTNHPDEIAGSRIGFPSNFDISSPLQDDDALSFRLAGNNHHPIRHLLAIKGLIALTDAGEWTITGAGGPQSPMTPSSLFADQQTYIGASSCRPVIVGNSILYVQARGATVHDLQFDLQVEGLGGRDLSIYATHLFDGFSLTEMDYAQSPNSIVWAIRSDGTLLGLTYLREQDVWGWHRHDTGAAGRFEHVCVVPEVDSDRVYVIVRRTIGGVFTRAIEQLESRLILNVSVDSFFVDAGLSYFGVPVNNIAGLGHLNGQVVAVVGDGTVVFNGDPAAANAANFTVTGGTLPVVLPANYSAIHAGLPIRFAEFETLDLDVQGSDVRAKVKRVERLSLLLEASDPSLLAGPDSANLTPVQLEVFQTPSWTFEGVVDTAVTSNFDYPGRVFVRHTDPTPFTVLALLPDVEPGG